MRIWKSYALVTSMVLGASAAQAACPAGTTSKGQFNGKELCAMQKRYLSSELVLTANNHYLLPEGIFVGGDNSQPSTLRIEAGTTVYANPGAFLVIRRGSKIFAEGTSQKPVVFTSAKLNDRKRGEWGGIVLNGNAPINACAGSAPVCEAISEGIKEEQVKFGGADANDSSGSLRYVRVEFGGYPIAPDNELNGITFNGVGARTDVDFIQVHMNADDGVEFFGGTVNAKHLVLTGNDDDALDWDMGFSGKLQFVAIKQSDDIGDNGFESSNLKSPMNAQPRSNPLISNVTMIGGAKSGFGLMMKEGTGGRISNAVVTGYQKGCLKLSGGETFSAGALSLTNVVMSCAKNFDDLAADPFKTSEWFAKQAGNKLADPMLDGFVPKAGSPLLGKGSAPEDLFFEDVNFIGAVGSTRANWTTGWTSSVTK